MAMRFLVNRIEDARAKNAYECVLLLLGIGFSIVIVFLSTKQTMYLFHSQQVSSALRLPMFIPYLAIPLGFLFMLLGFVEEFYQRVSGNF